MLESDRSSNRSSCCATAVGVPGIAVLSKRTDSDDGVQDILGPSAVPAAPRQLASSGVSYVKLQPSKDLAILASTSDETIQAVKDDTERLAFPLPFAWSTDPLLTAISKVASHRTMSTLKAEAGLMGLKSAAQFAACGMPLSAHQVFWDPDSEAADQPLLWSSDLIPTVREYLAALQDVMIAVQDPACKTFCYRRIKFLEGKFNFHLMFNSNAEIEETKNNKHRDFYNVRKVDTHVHHSACMHQKHLLRFIRYRPTLPPGNLLWKKYRTEGDTVVATEGGQGITLKDLFQKELGFSASEASVDHLNVHALGRFLAELTKEVIADLDDRKYQHAEWRVSIYGRSYEEWERLASWVVDNKLHSRRVRWIIQVPRLYHVYRKRGEIDNFGTLLRNVFEPLFEAVKNPTKHRKIYLFLQTMVGFDSVDDESRVSKYTMEGGDLPAPSDWASSNNPPYSYWIFYMYANIRALNLFLEARNMRPLSFRPHCGEAGSTSHLAAAFLLADGINHGILLKGAPVLEYMFYLKQIGIAVSPLSNNALFMDIAPAYCFSPCFNVAFFSFSGFEDEFKRHWLGDTYWLPGCKGNDMRRTNVSNIRLQYRIDTWREELEYMRELLNMRMVLTVSQQQHSECAGPAASQASSSSQFLQVPQGAHVMGPQDNRSSSPAHTADTTLSPPVKERPHPSRLSPSSHSDAPSPSLVSSNPHSVISSPELAAQSASGLPLKKRSLAEQELDELSCAAEQLTLSMKLRLPPPQSEQDKQ
ncbi:adenosine monophosphate deaminase, putative [Eimeria praecox]|uniref:Adenosine monophosphate deaminase, putative n=1 Tax=Eimeria praecox TaxID=51316 RepID=U6GMZ6_9EIME|nr:adenosine monophosphate deaminase, putative [Eimeria praecox]